MATERNVVDFKIHNLTEEQFQELKAQGKIDPNAVYCTPDESLKRNQITNCITEIPQNIKLVRDGGTITIKAGSVVHRAYGNLDTTYTFTSDTTLTPTYNGQYYVIPYGSSMFLAHFDGTSSSVIANRPTSISVGTGAFFATDENKIYVTSNSGATWTDASSLSLPIAVITVKDGALSSIDHIFNGFGFIGGTVFVLPGVKGLVPNGRNADGTLKNIWLTVNSVKTNNYTGTNNNLLWGFAPNVYFQTGSVVQYDSINNIINWKVCIFAKSTAENGRITSFEPKPAFNAVDYSDFENTVEGINSSISAVDSSAVHKTGNETINGSKTFKQNLLLSYDSLDLSTVKESGSWHTWCQVFDKNGVRASYIETAHKADGGVQQQFGVQKTIDGTKYSSFIRVYIDANKKQHYELGGSPESGSNGTDIATTAWSNAKFLPLAGGTMSGTITSTVTNSIKRNVDNSYLEFYGGTSSSNAAFLRLDGKDGSGAGQFILATSGGSSARKTLNGKPDGTLTWKGTNVLTDSYCGSTTQKIGLFSGGEGLVDYTDGGAWLQLYGSNSQNGGGYINGSFRIGASLGADNKKQLIGKANGELTWDGFPVVTTEAKSLAQKGYVKFNNGLIIQWGELAVDSSGRYTVNFETPFSSTNYTITAMGVSTGKITTYAYVQYGEKTTTYVQLATVADATHNGVRWMAIGY